MKNILIITTQYVPEAVGRASRIHEMAKDLKTNYNVRVIAPPPTWPHSKFPAVKYLYRRERIDGIDVLRLWTYQPKTDNPSIFGKIGYHFIFPIIVNFSFLTTLRHVSSVIISAQPPPILLTVLAAIMYRKKILLDIGDLDYDEALDEKGFKQPSILKNLIMKLQKYCWKKSDWIITNNLGIQTKLKKILKNNPSKITYFPFNVDTNIFKKHDIKTEKQIVYTGMFGALQNLSPLIKAMKLITKEIPDFTLQLYGGGKFQEDLQVIVKKLNLEKNCVFNDPVPRNELPLILSQSLVGIVPLAFDNSLSFATPSKTFEYMSNSLPVLGYGPSNALNTILKESDAGVYLFTDDPKKIADSLIRMLKDKNMLKKFGGNGRKYIENRENFSNLTKML
jgi:glycosyltransferase involved in cell wall biosynthesis